LRLRKYRPEPFLETTEYQKFQEFCDACKEDRYIGLCLGYSGVGKTLAAFHYANWKYFNHLQNPHFGIVEGWDAEILRAADTVVYTPLGSTTANAVLVQILSLVSKTESIVFKEVGCADSDEGQIRLVIIDEANRLKYQSLEHIRDLFDQLRIGVVFMGLHGLEKVISCLPQFRNRVGFRHEFKPLPVADMTALIESDSFKDLRLGLGTKHFESTETIAKLARATSGNMRTLNRLCLQIKRVMRVNELDTITDDVVETSRQSLIIGT
jgi:DNA transposition AAA+ family ATPase